MYKRCDLNPQRLYLWIYNKNLEQNIQCLLKHESYCRATSSYKALTETLADCINCHYYVLNIGNLCWTLLWIQYFSIDEQCLNLMTERSEQ
uniref:Exportin-T isoform X4 n=1 Tax=Rhizophora mucronata TaxID=61149 RepID=A0A2P2LEH1_RHIMU